jgi:hypothetical protein
MSATDHAYLSAFNGSFRGVLCWHELNRLWERVRAAADAGWYVYALGEPPPEMPAEPARLVAFLSEIDVLLREEHAEDYCGLVYADDFDSPSFIKIYDPHQLGSVCGASGRRTLPGWVLSKLRPVDLPAAQPPPGNRRRWWQRLF